MSAPMWLTLGVIDALSGYALSRALLPLLADVAALRLRVEAAERAVQGMGGSGDSVDAQRVGLTPEGVAVADALGADEEAMLAGWSRPDTRLHWEHGRDGETPCGAVNPPVATRHAREVRHGAGVCPECANAAAEVGS